MMSFVVGSVARPKSMAVTDSPDARAGAQRPLFLQEIHRVLALGGAPLFENSRVAHATASRTRWLIVIYFVRIIIEDTVSLNTGGII